MSGFVFSRLSKLHQLMLSQGLAVKSLDLDRSTNPPAVVIDCAPGDLAAAQALAASFDWSKEAEQADREAAEPDLSILLQQAAAAVSAINDYLAIADAATAAQVRAEVKQIDLRQRAVIKALARAIRIVMASR